MIVTLYADAAGAVYPRRDTDPPHFSAPTGTAAALTFDGDSNPGLAADLWANVVAYTIANGKLLKHGQPIAIAADGPTKAALDNLLAQADAAVTTNNTFLALSNPSNAQVLSEVQALARQNNAIIKRLKLLGRLTGQGS